MLWLLPGPPGFACWICLLWYLVLCTVESLYLLYLLFISWFICSRRWCMDKLGVFHANQTTMCLDPHLNKGWGWHSETGLSPPVKYFYWPLHTSFVNHLCYLCLVFIMLSGLFIAACGHLLGKGWPLGPCLWCLIVFLSLSHVVSLVRCGTWLYRFLIFSAFLILMMQIPNTKKPRMCVHLLLIV